MSKEPYRMVVSSKLYFDTSNRFHSKYNRCNLLKFGGKEFRINLRTDVKGLYDMWSRNFPDNVEWTEADGVVDVFAGNGNEDSARLYDKENHRIVTINDVYYGCVKFGYRVVLADLMLGSGLTTIHSAGVMIDGKVVVITGPSGAGKNTTMNYLDGKYNGIFLWDDFGVLSKDGEAYLSNEEHHHMSQESASSLLPYFEDWGDLMCEERASNKYMVPLHEHRKTARNCLDSNDPIKVDTLVIVTNEPNSNIVKSVDAATALDIFRTPAYSHAWECKVPFMNEHLMMDCVELHQLKDEYAEIFDNIPNIVVANNTRQEVDKMKYLQGVESCIFDR